MDPATNVTALTLRVATLEAGLQELAATSTLRTVVAGHLWTLQAGIFVFLMQVSPAARWIFYCFRPLSCVLQPLADQFLSFSWSVHLPYAFLELLVSSARALPHFLSLFFLSYPGRFTGGFLSYTGGLEFDISGFLLWHSETRLFCFPPLHYILHLSVWGSVGDHELHYGG